jgi:hypothetical protein
MFSSDSGKNAYYFCGWSEVMDEFDHRNGIRNSNIHDYHVKLVHLARHNGTGALRHREYRILMDTTYF